MTRRLGALGLVALLAFASGGWLHRSGSARGARAEARHGARFRSRTGRALPEGGGIQPDLLVRGDDAQLRAAIDLVTRTEVSHAVY